MVLPGENVLTRLVGSVRERATRRLWSRLAHAASPKLVDALEALLVVPVDVHQVGGAGQAEVEQRHEALPAGKDLGVVAEVGR